jgi:hypothetical protein
MPSAKSASAAERLLQRANSDRCCAMHFFTLRAGSGPSLQARGLKGDPAKAAIH